MRAISTLKAIQYYQFLSLNIFRTLWEWFRYSMTLWITKSVCTNRDYSNWSKIALFDAKCSKVHNVFAEKNEVQTKSKVISNIADGVMLKSNVTAWHQRDHCHQCCRRIKFQFRSWWCYGMYAHDMKSSCLT